MPRTPKIAGRRKAKDFESFEASLLFCPRCREAQPVRRRLLLVLPDGELYEYTCRVCGASVGTQRDSGAPQEPRIVLA
jgi:hypothetical protein